MSELNEEEAGAPWHQRLLRSSSLPTQLLHSGTSFLMMAGMARFAPTESFALSAAFFLLVTLTSSLNVYVLSAAWLRNGEDEDLQPLAGFTLLISLLLSLALTGFWAVYRHWAFGPAPAWELPNVGLGAFSYLYCLAWRRQLMLDARFHLATAGDALRALMILGGGAALHLTGAGLAFPLFLLVFVLGHVGGVAPVLHEVLGHAVARPPQGRWLGRALQPLAAITRGDWLSVASGLANVVFSQAASLLAPMLIGAQQYATLRAYELFLFPVIFMAQVLDPLYMRRFRNADAGRATVRAADILPPALLMFAPLAGGLVLAWAVPPMRPLMAGLVAPDYRAAAWLVVPVLMLSGWISLNAPIRWRLMVAGAGSPLLKGTGVGILVSLGLLWTLTRQHPEAWTVLAAKMAYEACLFLAGLAGLHGLSRRKESP